MSAFATAKDAKQFLIGRVRARAAHEGHELTPVEAYGLEISVEEEGDEALEAAFDREHEMQEFERRMTKLLERALEDDRTERVDEVGLWEDAYDTLRRGDHYILAMLKPVLRPSLFRRLGKALGR